MIVYVCTSKLDVNNTWATILLSYLIILLFNFHGANQSTGCFQFNIFQQKPNNKTQWRHVLDKFGKSLIPNQKSSTCTSQPETNYANQSAKNGIRLV